MLLYEESQKKLELMMQETSPVQRWFPRVETEEKRNRMNCCWAGTWLITIQASFYILDSSSFLPSTFEKRPSTQTRLLGFHPSLGLIAWSTFKRLLQLRMKRAGRRLESKGRNHSSSTNYKNRIWKTNVNRSPAGNPFTGDSWETVTIQREKQEKRRKSCGNPETETGG